jgi:Mrp family chromosome partitioning ATPase
MSSELLGTAILSESAGSKRQLSVTMETASLAKVAELRSGENWGETLLAAARLKHVLAGKRRLVVVTGFDATEGASMLTARIGAAMAEIDKDNVLIVDANVESPQMGAIFGIRDAPGLQDVLEGRLAVKDVLCSLEPSNLRLLPLGASSVPLNSLLTSPRCALVMNELREHFRFIVADAGVIKSAEGTLLASLSDGVLIALAAGQRTKEEVANFQEELRRLQIPLLGAVLTKRTSARA